MYSRRRKINILFLILLIFRLATWTLILSWILVECAPGPLQADPPIGFLPDTEWRGAPPLPPPKASFKTDVLDIISREEGIINLL